MDEKPKETLELNTITDSLGIVGDAVASDSEGAINISSQEDLESFLKTLIYSTNELVNQLEELNIIQKDLILDEQRRTAENLSELKAKGIRSEESGAALTEPLNNLGLAIDNLTELLKTVEFGGSGILDSLSGLSPGLVDSNKTKDNTPKKSGGKVPITFGKVGKALGAGIGGIVGGLALDSASQYAEAEGYEKTAAGTAILSEGLSYAGLGATVGSIVPVIGTAAGATLGAAFGLTKGYFERGSELFDEAPTIGIETSLNESIPISPPVSATPDMSTTLLTKTEELEAKESSVKIAEPIILDQRGTNQINNQIQTKLVDYGVAGVDEVPDPNFYNGGDLELELYP